MKQILLFTAVLLLSGCAAQFNPGMTLIAHRGGASLGNENTLSCIARGMEYGVDMVEVDVHLSADGALIVCHDETIDRTTDGHGRIEEMTLAELRNVRIKDAATGLPTDETLPLLEEVLEMVKGKCGLLLEVKRTRADQYPGIEQQILALLDATGMRDAVVIQSFNDSVIETVHSLAPDIPVEKLFFCKLPFSLIFDNGFNSFSFDKYRYVRAFNTCGPLTGRRFVRKMHEAGFRVNIWTVDNPSRVVTGVDGVITNAPDRFRGEKQ